MNPTELSGRVLRCSALLALLPFALLACKHDSHDSGPRSELPTLTAGAHALVIDGDEAAHDGTVFVGSTGAAYAVFTDDSNVAASVVYRRDDNASAWRRVPRATSDLQLGSRLDVPLTVAAWNAPAAATDYRALLGDTAIHFTLAPDDKLTASAAGCRLTGTIAGVDLANAASAALNFTGCAANGEPGDGDYDGIAYVDPEAPNAAFHVVVDDGSAIRDFYVYAP